MTFIVKGGRIVYGDNAELKEDGVHGRGFYDSTTTEANAQLVDEDSPAPFNGSWYTWDGNEISHSEAGLDHLKEEKKKIIRREFSEIENDPVTDASGIVWNGGFNSAVAIDGATRIAETMASTTVGIHDIKNSKHELLVADARAVAAIIGSAWSAQFTIKQERMVACDSATNKQEIDAA